MSYDKSGQPAYPAYTNPPYPIPTATVYAMPVQPNAHVIRDYMAWSIVNLFCGWGIGGVLPLIFSILCRNSKNANDYSGAQTMSTLALVFNILVTIGGVVGWISFIAVMAVYIAAINNAH